MKKLLDLLASGAANHAELEGRFSIVEAVRSRQKLAVQQAGCDATKGKTPSDFPEMVRSIRRKWHPFFRGEQF